ncbi:MAG: ABC transporter ATP-binding protein [Actinobacteria bacterium]|nr:ABC transporter ATP-binding protein [Actinomycetota bacterium]
MLILPLAVLALLPARDPVPVGAGGEVLVEVRGLRKWFPVQKGFIANLLSRGHTDYVKAVDDVSFTIKRGEVLGLAGESGSGKSTVGRLVLRLLDPTEGEVVVDGVDLARLDKENLRVYRHKMQVVFQDPLASLNPRMTVGQAIEHPAQIHLPDTTPEERKRLVFELLDAVGMSPPDFFYSKYPHQVSGGQRQRIVLARALITQPDLIVADEPIASADVSVQALLLELMIKLKDEFDLTYLFITHDLATTKYICDRIGIMYLGKIVEIGPLQEVFENPQHPYTRALLSAVPVPDPRHRRTEPLPTGEIPNPINPPPGCNFHPRCPIAAAGVCDGELPSLRPVPGSEDHLVSCHLRTGDHTHLDPARTGGPSA